MFKEVEESFTSYVGANYDLTDNNITSRMAHSFRVCQLCKLIANEEKFNENDVEIVTIAGLLHDYGRFHQWKSYKSQRDVLTEDHGDLAIKLLFEENEITFYTDKIRNYDEIFDAIKYHNKLELPSVISDHNITILKVVKDADKIDLWYQWTISEQPKEETEDNSEISDTVKQQFLNHKLIKYNKEMTNNELILARLSFIFDVVFKYSFKYIKDNDLVNKIYNQINNKEMFTEYFEIIKKYIEEKIGDENA